LRHSLEITFKRFQTSTPFSPILNRSTHYSIQEDYLINIPNRLGFSYARLRDTKNEKINTQQHPTTTPNNIIKQQHQITTSNNSSNINNSNNNKSRRQSKQIFKP